MPEHVPCVCGHEKDDHLARLSIPNNVYGPCSEMADKWHRCACTEYEADR